MSWQGNFESCCGRTSFWWRHSRDTAVPVEPGGNSPHHAACLSVREAQEAHIFQASPQWSSTSGISANSSHQSGISHACACQVTHLLYSSTGGSGEELFPSCSSALPAGSWRKQSTSGPNSSGGSRSKSRKGSPVSLSSPDPGPHWVPPVLSPGPSSAVVMTLRVGMGVWPASSDGLAQPFYLLLLGNCSCQGTPMGFPHLSKVSLSGGTPPLGGLAPRRLGICWTRLLQISWWMTCLLPQVVFQGGHYIESQFLHLFQPTGWGPW